MKLSEFDFHLPKELIAQSPAPKRDESRLMIVDRSSGEILHEKFSAITRFLKNRPLMLFNDTKVIPAKLMARVKSSGKSVETLLVREVQPGTWTALVKGLGKLQTGTQLTFGKGDLTATLIDKENGRGILAFDTADDLLSRIGEIGQAPLPPYIQRKPAHSADTRNEDLDRYQTVYAKHPGAIAAPTAGLHFTTELLATISNDFADIDHLTLHVGPGTFQPVREEIIENHMMEKEFFNISASTWNKVCEAKANKKTLLAVGTTTTRVLESLDFDSRVDREVTGSTDSFIYPGYVFKNVSQLLTNFHLPKSTLYLLVSAFAGKELIRNAYAEAVQKKYRFYSFGDAMLIL